MISPATIRQNTQSGAASVMAVTLVAVPDAGRPPVRWPARARQASFVEEIPPST
ncbi:hypothetical protein GCM10028783_40710 [Modestobacter muralis]